ncbi:MAG: site-specific integrase [bacterium]|nr:site-specific integrase [bacterium]
MPTGHVEKRSKNAWSIVIDLGRDSATGQRQRIRRTVKGATKRQAEAELRRLLAEVEAGTYVEPTKLTLGEYLRRWLADGPGQRVRPRTLEDYARVAERHIVPALGHVRLSALQPLQIQELYSRLLEDGRLDGTGSLSPRSVQLVHVVLHSALRQAVRWLLIVRNPADAVDVPRPRRRQPPMLRPDALTRLLEAARGHRDETLVQFALMTGMRRGELLALTWEAVDLERRVVQVYRALARVPGGSAPAEAPKTKRSRRQVALPVAAVQLLRDLRRRQLEDRLRAGPTYQDQDLVFCNADGSRIYPDAVSHRFRAISLQAGLGGFRFHDLRHAHATWLLAQGVHPKVVQERLGHEAVSTTLDIYSHVVPTLQREAADAIDATIGHRLGTESRRRPD